MDSNNSDKQWDSKNRLVLYYYSEQLLVRGTKFATYERKYFFLLLIIFRLESKMLQIVVALFLIKDEKAWFWWIYDELINWTSKRYS